MTAIAEKTTEPQKTLEPKTLDNLSTAMHGDEHFAEEAQLAGLVGSDSENLKDAIKGESYEVDTMYREFAQAAKNAGDTAVADRFEEIRHDELGHLKSVLAKLKA